jgi:hypothetical protein
MTTLPPFGSLITLTDVQNVFGGQIPIDMGEYYEGGTFVPVGTGVPTSGMLRLSQDFGGKSAASQILPVASPLLDTYTGAAAAFAMRRIRSAYTGSILQIQRVSDSATLNVGYTSDNSLDVDAISTFLGASAGRILIWYDQSGNNRHMSFKNNVAWTGSDEIVFNGVDQYGACDGTVSGSQSATPENMGLNGATSKSIVVSAKVHGNRGNSSGAIFDFGSFNATGRHIMLRLEGQYKAFRLNHWAADIVWNVTEDNQSATWIYSYNGTTANIYEGSTLRGSLTVTLTTAGNPLEIGRGQQTSHFAGAVSMLLVFPTAYTATQAANINRDAHLATRPYQAFTYTGADQTYTVPAGVTQLAVKLWGAGGGSGAHSTSGLNGTGGAGGLTCGILSVTPGETLTVMVGQGGVVGQFGVLLSATYGGGGGSGNGSTAYAIGSAGGRSAIRRGVQELVTAGGGGSGGASGTSIFSDPHGGAGGGLAGQTSFGFRIAGGGTQTVGFANGLSGSPAGTLFTGATGGGAGGGGGYYGGSSGNASASTTRGGAGGGSGYIGGALTGITVGGNAEVPPETSAADYPTSTGVARGGVSVGATPNGGGNGFVAIYPIQSGTLIGTVILTNSGAALTSMTISVTIPYVSSIRTDFQDVYFEDAATSTTLSHWFETVTAGVSAVAWLMVPTYTTDRLLYIRKGTSFRSLGNANSVFLIYDPFTTFYSSAWTRSSTTAVATSASGLVMNSTTFHYIYTNFNMGLDVEVEASVQSSSANAIPEISSRGSFNTTVDHAGIKGRFDCRTGLSGEGIGQILRRPYNGWVVINEKATGSGSFPSNNTAQKVGWEARGNRFFVYYNDTVASLPFFSTLSAYNTDGRVGLHNHNGQPIRWNWVRCYKTTSQILGQNLFLPMTNAAQSFSLSNLTLNIDFTLGSYPGTGTMVYDATGRGNDFTLLGSTYTYNATSNFMAFNNLGAGSTVGMLGGKGSHLLNIDMDHTIEIVVANASTNAGSTFLYFASPEGNRMINIHLPWTGNRIIYDVRGTGNTSRIDYTDSTEGLLQLRHYVFRCSRQSVPHREIFINGVSVANSGAFATSTADDWGGSCNIAWANWSGEVYYVRVYNRALSNAEVWQNFKAAQARHGIIVHQLDRLPPTTRTACRGAYAAYRVSSFYTGPTVRLRRNIDNAEQDFFADVHGNMGTALNAGGTPFETWIGGNTAFVTTWYDQSGSGRHATQTTTTAQPRFILGTVDFRTFTTTRDMTIPSDTIPVGTITTSNKHTIVITHGAFSTLSTNGTLIYAGDATTGTVYMLHITNAAGTQGYTYVTGSTGFSPAGRRTGATVFAIANGVTRSMLVPNGVRLTSDTPATFGSVSVGTQYIGRRHPTLSSQPANMFIYNVVIFGTDLSQNEVQIMDGFGNIMQVGISYGIRHFNRVLGQGRPRPFYVMNASNPDATIYQNNTGETAMSALTFTQAHTRMIDGEWIVIMSATDRGNLSTPVAANEGLEYKFYIPVASTYNIQLLIYAPTGNNDAIWIQLNTGTITSFTPNAVFQVQDAFWVSALANQSIAPGYHSIRLWRHEAMGIGGIRVVQAAESFSFNFDASTLVAIHRENDPIPTWTNSGTYYDLTAIGAGITAPTFGMTGLYPHVRFTDASQSHFALNKPTSLVLGNGFALFAVINFDLVNTNERILQFGSTQGSNNNTVLWDRSADTLRVVVDNGTTRVFFHVSASVNLNTWSVFAIRVTSGSGPTGQYFVNGIPLGTSYTGTTNLSSRVSTFGYIARNLVSGSYLTGNIRELIIIDAISAAMLPSVANMERISTNLVYKWGIEMFAIRFDANSLASSLSPGNTVTSWTNSGTLALTATASGTPTFLKEQDYNHIRFVQSALDHFTLPSITWSISTGMTVFAVVRHDSQSVNFNRIFQFANANNDDRIALFRNSTTQYGMVAANGSTVVMQITATTPTTYSHQAMWHVIAARVVNSATPTTAFYHNATGLTSTTVTSAALITDKTYTENSIGRNQSSYLDASLRELIIHNTALTVNHIQEISWRLMTKWGIA